MISGSPLPQLAVSQGSCSFGRGHFVLQESTEQNWKERVRTRQHLTAQQHLPTEQGWFILQKSALARAAWSSCLWHDGFGTAVASPRVFPNNRQIAVCCWSPHSRSGFSQRFFGMCWFLQEDHLFAAKAESAFQNNLVMELFFLLIMLSKQNPVDLIFCY